MPGTVRVLQENAATRPMAVSGAAAGSGYAGSLSLVLVWVMGKLGVDMPPEVAAAFTVVVMGVVSVVAPHWVLKRLHGKFVDVPGDVFGGAPEPDPEPEPAPEPQKRKKPAAGPQKPPQHPKRDRPRKPVAKPEAVRSSAMEDTQYHAPPQRPARRRPPAQPHHRPAHTGLVDLSADSYGRHART